MKHFCVIVPAYNEAVVIKATLQALMVAGAHAEDIYLVDDCSKDDTGDIARSLGVNVLRNDPNIGKALGIERVVKEFGLVEKYQFIALMDADTLVDVEYFPDMLEKFDEPVLTKPNYKSLRRDLKLMGSWNKELDERLKREGTTLNDIPKLPVAIRSKYEVGIVCGRPISQPYNWLTAYRALCYANGHYVYRRAQGKVGMICIAPGCSTMYRSVIFNRLNWKNGTSAEDMYVTIQAYHQGICKIAYANKAKVYTQTPRTLPSYMKQMDRWYGGTWQVIARLRVYWGMMKVDWECKLLWTEGLIMAVFRLVLPFVAILSPLFLKPDASFPWYANLLLSWITGDPWYLGSLNAVLILMIGGYIGSVPAMLVFAILERRFDIVKYSPLYPMMWYIDAFFFIRAFVKAVILKQDIKWFSPPRYVGGR